VGKKPCNPRYKKKMFVPTNKGKEVAYLKYGSTTKKTPQMFLLKNYGQVIKKCHPQIATKARVKQ
jgi:hypothetical protein